jgi:flagella basal body P-ring formation protein FlgA
VSKSGKAFFRYTRMLSAVTTASVILLMSLPVLAGSLTPETVLETYFAEHYPWQDIEIRNVKVTGEFKKRAPDSIIVEKGPIGKAIFSFMYKSGAKATVRAFVRAFDLVIKSKRPFRKGHVIKRDDIYTEKMDIRKMPGGAVRKPEMLIGKSLRRTIIANIPVVEGMVEHSHAVKRGKNVVLLIKNRGLKITAMGKMKEKGYVGSSVRAVNLSSQKEVTGVLIDENTVEVML